MTLKDLKKRVSLETKQQTMFFQRLQNKPFWIWKIEEHKQEDIRIYGHCCFNHIIGLPQKDGANKPLYEYEKMIFDSLVTQLGNASSNKHIWMKKATDEFQAIEMIADLALLLARIRGNAYAYESKKQLELN